MNNIDGSKKGLAPEEREVLLGKLKERFEKNMDRHKSIEWADLRTKLKADAGKLWSLNEMELTGGEQGNGDGPAV